MGNNDDMVNIGTPERPILIPADNLEDPASGFWQGVANGSSLVGGEGGIDLDIALQAAESGKVNDSKG